MTKERLEKIKENVHARCGVANITGIGMTAPDREEVELIKEIERLSYIINKLVERIVLDFNYVCNELSDDYVIGIRNEAKSIYRQLQEFKGVDEE